MSSNHWSSKDWRWERLIRDLKREGLEHVPADSIQKWLSLALLSIPRRTDDERLRQILSFYYGFYEGLEPQTIATIATWMRLSMVWISVLKKRGLQILRVELIRLHRDDTKGSGKKRADESISAQDEMFDLFLTG